MPTTEVGVPVTEVGVPVTEVGVPTTEVDVPVIEVDVPATNAVPLTSGTKNKLSTAQKIAKLSSLSLFPKHVCNGKNPGQTMVCSIGAPA